VPGRVEPDRAHGASNAQTALTTSLNISAPHGALLRRLRTVCGRGGELGVAEEVAGVAVDGAAARLVAEDRQPGGIPARTWRAGRSSGHPARAHGRAQVLRLLPRRDVVAVQERPRQRHHRRERRRTQPGRPEHRFGQQPRIGLPAHCLRDQPHDDVVGVGVGIARPGANTSGSSRTQSITCMDETNLCGSAPVSSTNPCEVVKFGSPLVWLNNWRTVTPPQAAGSPGARSAIVSSRPSPRARPPIARGHAVPPRRPSAQPRIHRRRQGASSSAPRQAPPSATKPTARAQRRAPSNAARPYTPAESQSR
jgi:hypothetical protein